MTSGQTEVTERVERLTRGADFSWVAAALVERRDDILTRWRAAAARQPFHSGRTGRAVADHIPNLFDALTSLLERTAPRSVAPEAPLDDDAVIAAAQSHARVRFEQGLKAADVVVEFRLLRQEIGSALRVAIDTDAPTSDVIGADLIVHDALDGAISLALSALTTHVEETREEFLATTIHDVQQPITAIKGNLQLAIRQLGRAEIDVEATINTLRRVEAEADRMSVLVRTLSQASQATLGRLEPQRALVDLAKIVEEMRKRLDPDAFERVTLALNGDPGVGYTGEWDEHMLERVVANLLSNAIKYSPDYSPVGVSLSGDADSVTLTVRDAGVGLAPTELDGLFRRYSRLNGAISSGVQGLGLGLFLSRSLVEAHDGRIWAESDGLGLGTTVRVSLPRRA